MRFRDLALIIITLGAFVGLCRPATADPLPMDNPTTINGVETGSSQQDPRWSSYPVRVEFSNGGAQYVAGAHVALNTGGRQSASFDCFGSGVLFRMKPGAYKISATLTDEPGSGERSATFSAPASGQKPVVIQFPVQPNK